MRQRRTTATLMATTMKTTTSSAAEAIISALCYVTKDWARQRKAEERDRSRQANRYRRLVRQFKRTVKDAAAEVMEAAYMKASANGTLPANARQVMYAARPMIQEITGEALDDQYFTQTLLPDYLNDHPDLDWDIAYDARGHFREPHTERSIGLGTLDVRAYLDRLRGPKFIDPGLSSGRVDTFGPDCRFGAVLFLEKEGFDEILRAAEIAERFDIGIMSTKGVSVTAARHLVDNVCGTLGIPLLVLHDFDKSGFSILGTLSRDTRRYRFERSFDVIDLGLRLADVQAFGLEDRYEDAFDKGSAASRARNMRLNGATREEIELLLHRRVELNAMTSDELVRFIEQKLQQNGIGKIVPDSKVLAETYRTFARGVRLKKRVDELLAAEGEEDQIKVPRSLDKQVRAYIAANPAARWDHVVGRIAGAELQGEEGV
jgi:DNA topoisomerase 6 subunit A-like protein